MQNIQQKAKNYANTYKTELTQSVLPFWLGNSKDEESGGYFTCLNREGKVFDTDKFLWLQAREVWTMSMLFNRFEQNPEWLAFAQHGIDFLQENGRDASGDWYFSLNKAGKPLVQPYNIFSDCFASMAFGQYALATQQAEYAEIAKATFSQILKRQQNPKGKYNKAYPDTRPLKNLPCR